MPRKLSVIPAILPLIFGCAPFQQASASSFTPEQSSLIDTTCANVMGLRKGEFYYQECQDSLGHSMARKIAAQSAVTAYDTCRGHGLAEGSAEFSVCALNEQSRSAPSANGMQAEPVDLSSAADLLQSGKSYYNVTPSVQFQRERYACAQLGLLPNSSLFGTCTASLEGALMPYN